MSKTSNHQPSLKKNSNTQPTDALLKQQVSKSTPLNNLTDCVFYLKDMCTKGDKCEFRHCEATKHNTRICKFWTRGECLNKDCSFRHPTIKPTVEPTVTPCYFYSIGSCTKVNCPFLHQKPEANNNTTINNESTTNNNEELKKRKEIVKENKLDNKLVNNNEVQNTKKRKFVRDIKRKENDDSILSNDKEIEKEEKDISEVVTPVISEISQEIICPQNNIQQQKETTNQENEEKSTVKETKEIKRKGWKKPMASSIKKKTKTHHSHSPIKEHIPLEEKQPFNVKQTGTDDFEDELKQFEESLSTTPFTEIKTVGAQMDWESTLEEFKEYL
ncbi:hypothetical protein ABK040_004082 [Willaertia magna]